jgi:two-component system sporulation sensor kinase B
LKFIVFLVLNIISATLFLLFYKQKSKIAFYYAGYITAFSLGLLAITLDPHPELYLEPFTFPHLLARICSVLSYRMSPYLLLNAAISVAGIYENDDKKRRATIIFAGIPVFLGFCIDVMNPRQSFIFFYPDYLPNFWWLISSWSIFYVLLSNILLCYTSIIEKIPKIKKQKLIILYLTLPSLFIGWMVYVEPVRGEHDFTNLTGIFGAFLFLMIIIAFARTGFIGLRISFEHDFMDRSIRALYSGASMINHAIRNELQLINIATQNLKKINSPDAIQYIKIIENASRHLEDLARRFSEKTKPIILFMEETDISQLVEGIFNSMAEIFALRNITISKQYQENPAMVKCDKVHMKEVLLNIFYNSIEAMPRGGSITFTIYSKRRFIHIDVADTGIGMSKDDMEHMFEPFYSTKKVEKNLGLGLTYCFAVMKQHHGSLSITSEENKGTTVTLSLPKS